MVRAALSMNFIGFAVGVGLTTGLNSAANGGGFNYALDDGSAEAFVGAGSPPFGIAALNHFVAAEGATTITHISVAWGDVPDGEPATVLLYRDPNGDGNPIDGELAFAALVATEGTGDELTGVAQFTDYAIDPVVLAPGESFFVGFWLQQPAGNWHPASLDTSSAAGESWAIITFENFWITDLEINFVPPTPVGPSLGLPAGNWLVRAVAVPSPGAAVLLLLGAVARARRSRHSAVLATSS